MTEDLPRTKIHGFDESGRGGQLRQNRRCVSAESGVDAKYVNPKEAGLILSDEFGNARVLPESYVHLAKLKDTKELIVFPGFFGYSPEERS